MSCIQQFLQSHLPQYLQSSLQAHRNHPSFLDFTSDRNAFSLLTDMLLFSAQGCSAREAEALGRLVRGKMIIAYQCLQNCPQLVRVGDSDLVIWMKGLQQVHVQMLQLLLRVVVCYIQTAHSQYLNNTILHLISEISYIYPLLKAELSINHPSLSLSHFLEKIFNAIAQKTINLNFVNCLERIKEECAFMGMVEKTIDRIIEAHKVDSEAQSKKVDISSNDSEEEAENWKENFQVYSDNAMLRKKKRTGKARTDLENRTPTKDRTIGVGIRYTPKTEKTQENTRNFDAKSPLKRTPIFKKIKKTVKKPMERTIYNGQTKKFIPKKSSNHSEHFFQNYLTSSSLINEPTAISFYQIGRRTEKKPSKPQPSDNEVNVFCVPETPRPAMDKKSNLLKKAYSMDFHKNGVSSFKI